MAHNVEYIARPDTPLPATKQDFLNRNTVLRPRMLNDDVDAIVVQLIDTEEFQKYLLPVYPEQSVQGDLFLDDAELARQIIEVAIEQDNTLVSGTKLKGVIRAMNVALRRYNYTRKQRREEAEMDWDGPGTHPNQG